MKDNRTLRIFRVGTVDGEMYPDFACEIREQEDGGLCSSATWEWMLPASMRDVTETAKAMGTSPLDLAYQMIQANPTLRVEIIE